MRAIREILVILCFLACLTLALSSALEAGRRLLGGPSLDRGYWGTLLGGLVLLVLLTVGTGH